MATPDATVPLLPAEIVPTIFLKISQKSQKKVVFRIDAEEGQILYDSRKNGCGTFSPCPLRSSLTLPVPIECIKEIRTGSAAEYYCTQFRFSGDAVDRVRPSHLTRFIIKQLTVDHHRVRAE